jgi:hypothetical protein
MQAQPFARCMVTPFGLAVILTLGLAGAEEGATVEDLSLDELLSTVPSEDRPKFDKLAEAIKQQLSAVKVYKVGDEPEKAVYVVGKTRDGMLAGLKTSVVET